MPVHPGSSHRNITPKTKSLSRTVKRTAKLSRTVPKTKKLD